MTEEKFIQLPYQNSVEITSPTAKYVPKVTVKAYAETVEEAKLDAFEQYTDLMGLLRYGE